MKMMTRRYLRKNDDEEWIDKDLRKWLHMKTQTPKTT